ncbi:MAG: glycosyltransferase 87 family protein [Gaiellaceae bacterium MAG52_C11]|nr:glycosyltransferase 87 family protein [Candidatus Gaiellasilicea maunaloa]
MRTRAALDLGVLAVLGGACLASTVWLGGELEPGDFGRPLGVLAAVAAAMLLPYVAAVAWVVWRRPPRRAALVLVVAVAAMLRLVLVSGEPALSNDVYRYVWDGRVQAAGINPYRHAPADPELAFLRDAEISPRLNRIGVPTAYPPVAQGLFGGLYRLHADSVPWTKLAIVLLDLLAVGLLAYLLARARRPPAWALVYAWHPLVVFELAGSGHVEGLAVLLVLGALAAAFSRRAVVTGVLLAAAALVKPYALVLAPAFLRRGRDLPTVLAAGALTVALAYAPFAGAGLRALGYLPGYLREEGFTSGYRFYLLGLVDGDPSAAVIALYVAAAAALLLGVAVSFLLRPPGSAGALAERALLLFTTVWVLTSPTYPWYALLAVALVPLARGAVLLPGAAIALLAPFLYLHISVAAHPDWPRHVVYGGCTLALVGAAAWKARSWLVQRSGAVANSRIPSANETFARKPSSTAARSVEAKT